MFSSVRKISGDAMAMTIDVFDRELQNAIDRVLKDVDDLTIPFTLITQSWFKSNRSLFAEKKSAPSGGKWADLSELYKPIKKKRWGFLYPILVASGAMMSSITFPNNPDSIHMIINKQTLVLGTKHKLAPYHHYGTNHIPARPFILVGSEQVAPPELNRRREAWIKILNDFVIQRSQQGLGG
jgi:phage gpG-like protein